MHLSHVDLGLNKNVVELIGIVIRTIILLKPKKLLKNHLFKTNIENQTILALIVEEV